MKISPGLLLEKQKIFQKGKVSMEIEATLKKDGKFWLIEIPALDAMTQGKTRKEALSMTEDLVHEMIISYFPDSNKGLKITIIDRSANVLGISSNNNRLMLALSLRRQREKSGLTVREASKKLGSESPNAYAQYERGKIGISLDKYETLLYAANPRTELHLRIS